MITGRESSWTSIFPVGTLRSFLSWAWLIYGCLAQMFSHLSESYLAPDGLLLAKDPDFMFNVLNSTSHIVHSSVLKGAKWDNGLEPTPRYSSYNCPFAVIAGSSGNNVARKRFTKGSMSYGSSCMTTTTHQLSSSQQGDGLGGSVPHCPEGRQSRAERWHPLSHYLPLRHPVTPCAEPSFTKSRRSKMVKRCNLRVTLLCGLY